MPNYIQAPTLVQNGVKQKENDKNFYLLPQTLMDKIFNELGNRSAEVRLMVILVGTKPGFKLSDAWVQERTGLSHASYNRARNSLIEREWLSYNKISNELIINYDNIYK